MKMINGWKALLVASTFAGTGLAAPTHAQTQAHACIEGLGMGSQQIWWTGGNSGKYLMDFTAGAPVLSNAGIGQTGSFEGTAVYTTPAGELLLYTDGDSIFNGQNNTQIGTGVGGDPSATEAALIVPDPAGSPTNDFYVFGNTGNTSGPINYTLVDIAANSIDPITPLDGGVVFSESLATVPHANGFDFWIISVTNASPAVNAYEVTASGVNNTPVSSSIPSLPSGTAAHRGTVVYHPPTGRLAIGFYSESTNQGHILTARFDESTGTASDFELHATGELGYGVAFSPDGSKLYYSVGTQGFNGSITHYDLASDTATPIDTGAWAMPRLAPDNNVYVVDFGATTMGVIQSPNTDPAGIGWDANGITLPEGSTAAYSLVNQTYAPCEILNEPAPPLAVTVPTLNHLGLFVLLLLAGLMPLMLGRRI